MPIVQRPVWSSTSPGGPTVHNELTGKQRFVSDKYLNQKPLASLIDMPTFSDLSTSFKLDEGTFVQLYAVGEMVSALAKVERPYFLGNDDLEFYFDLKNNRTAFDKEGDDRQYVFTWVEGYIGGLNSKKGNVNITISADSAHNKVLFSFKFPWKDLGYVIPAKNTKIGFDFAAADNDDGIRQEGKIAMFSKRDSLTRRTSEYGTLQLIDKIDKNYFLQTILSIYKPSSGFNWNDVSWSDVGNVIYGEIKDKYDCSAQIKSCWDNENLYFLVQLFDGLPYYRLKYITAEKRKVLKTFSDYGWIEDEKGNVVWQMNVLSATHAGGAIKNQKIDTLLYLKRGTYKLRYISDESHSFNNWDDDPPQTPFYGIVLYKAYCPARH